MDLFQFLNLLGGLSLFLFGMNVMGQALERRAGSRLRSLLGKMTTNPVAGLLTGLAVTAVIQSSSATTVMVVGFVNSGLMTLRQAINMIMGANIGTTVTAWILSLAGISSSNIFVRLLKPSSFTPIVAFVGMIYYMFCKSDKKKDTGLILLGFATLMFGMETMSGSVAGLREVPGFRDLFIMFKNPVLGVLAGTVLTAIIQSSSASVGILQALAVTGQVSYGAAIPIIMGQNIGTCVTAMLSAVGANKNAKRAALVHLSFNVIGTAVWLTVFCLVKWLLSPAILEESASLLGIAVAHSVFNVLCTVLMLPLSNMLEKLVCRLVPEGKKPETVMELDERLLTTPPVALARCRKVAADMANCAVTSMKQGIAALNDYTPALAEQVRQAENQTDHYEDILGTYLVKLSTRRISASDSNEAAKLLKIIGDFERISDHAVNLVQSAEELNSKDMSLSQEANRELSVLTGAVSEILDLSLEAFLKNDLGPAGMVEPLEQVIDELKEQLRTAHILRLQQEKCSIEAGFIWSDLLTDLERVSDHCSNIAGCVLDMQEGNLNLHESLRAMKEDREKFADRYLLYRKKYTVEPQA
ncbi:MAG: Na/Pi cotransporter family protein [Firmicutes bacterium]|nr:Na/Pi cotransporter family protein [Bacillota bacterium]MDY6159495.1 Na/Pi cotransporter family protein [Candidatus Faecousia sp.]